MKTFFSILNQKCPRCRQGAIFQSWFAMNPRCLSCSFEFEREQGYYTGAMFINWFFAIFIVGPVWLYLLFNGYSLWIIGSSTFLLLVLFTPLFFRYSRVIWLYLDFTTFHPE